MSPRKTTRSGRDFRLKVTSDRLEELRRRVDRHQEHLTKIRAAADQQRTHSVR